jgi:hypothetical protein
MNPLVAKLLILAGVVVFAGATGWKLRGDHDAADRLAEAEAMGQELVRRQGLVEDTAKAFEVFKAKSLITQREQQRKLNDEINKNPVYRECAVPDDGLRLLNDQIDSANDRLKSVGALLTGGEAGK